MLNALICLMILPSCVATLLEGSLLEMALEERDRRSAIPGKVPLYTNHDLSQLEVSHVSKGRSLTVAHDGISLRPPTPARKPVENTLADRIQLTRQKVDEAVNRLHVLQLRHNHLRNLYLNAGDENQRVRVEVELKSLVEELEQAQAAEQEARQAWLAIREEARKADVDVGREPKSQVYIEY